nr:MAG TPA: Spindle pole body component [Caudoviricetes sp.]
MLIIFQLKVIQVYFKLTLHIYLMYMGVRHKFKVVKLMVKSCI